MAELIIIKQNTQVSTQVTTIKHNKNNNRNIWFISHKYKLAQQVLVTIYSST